MANKTEKKETMIVMNRTKRSFTILVDGERVEFKGGTSMEVDYDTGKKLVDYPGVVDAAKIVPVRNEVKELQAKLAELNAELEKQKEENVELKKLIEG